MSLLQRLVAHAAQQADRPALLWPDGMIDYASLCTHVELAMQWLARQRVEVVAIDLDNGPDWVVLDIAALELGICVVPLPAFFSTAQLRHAVDRSGAQLVISDRPARLRERLGTVVIGGDLPADFGLRSGVALRVADNGAQGRPGNPDGTCKVTFTSGTTGTPKGVPLTWRQLRAVVASLVEVSRLSPADRHLALLPLAVLLENVAGVYASLWAGAQVVLAPLDTLGMQGASGVAGRELAEALLTTAATTAIFTPQTLQALVEVVEHAGADCPALRFAAVGGAPLSTRLLARAAALGLPVYEGYGLSECSSVVCLNAPGSSRPGSVGKALPHVDVSIADDGEVIVDGSGFRGYLGERRRADGPLRTGDVGSLDADGYLYLHGRRRNVFITAFGRNVAPEWVERELMLEPPIARAAVFGEGRPFNVAVVEAAARAQDGDVAAAITRANRALPDYARVTHFVVADAPFSPADGTLTGTGRLRREQVWQRYGDAIEHFYREDCTP